MTGTHGIDAGLVRAVELWPDRTAFRHMNATLTYAQLWERARELAACLQDHGVRQGDRVAIAMTKGLEMPVAIHGIWMAGAAFVPLDPAAPVARLASILDDCDIRLVVGADRSARLLRQLAVQRPLTILGTQIEGADCVVPGPAPPEFRPAVNSPEDLAYIIFTSGSTGTPKGITHTHASGLAFARAWAEHYRLTVEDVFFCTVPLHFDFSLADFFAAPLAGATTELVPEPVLLFPASVAELLERSGATIWSTVPYAVIQLCERGAAETRDLSRLRWLIYGGEPMPPAKLPAIRRIMDARISNSYGPAEVNQVTQYTVPEDHSIADPIPIGHPMSHADLARTDEGELLVASPSMMRGYWNRPDLDAAAFVLRDGRHFYRTGDAVSRDDRGLWHFHCRADRQVKLRGHRVELDEIEMVLCAHPAVSEAAAVVAEDGLSAWAFVTLSPDTNAPEDLRAHAAAQLPNYAVPDRIEIREGFARTGTGKIDRKALRTETA